MTGLDLLSQAMQMINDRAEPGYGKHTRLVWGDDWKVTAYRASDASITLYFIKDNGTRLDLQSGVILSYFNGWHVSKSARGNADQFVETITPHI